ncbi:Oidioi.mRNA.OKI2018_I69.YSR.g17101.t1.cds [Oikopleura dioica]|uniref:Oidioi.mRNA.OKI2018_I69.YSR.g17101.t1.cds n=1 Tax=Oikopleura dioica TaxID=34765 RepID=A0ABN7SNC3_OIKDI|nr:Oidioi.mRNA.OKI2018_I69.YSR.g17101.t1.cds [Oikopleura dioica]
MVKTSKTQTWLAGLDEEERKKGLITALRHRKLVQTKNAESEKLEKEEFLPKLQQTQADVDRRKNKEINQMQNHRCRRDNSETDHCNHNIFSVMAAAPGKSYKSGKSFNFETFFNETKFQINLFDKMFDQNDDQLSKNVENLSTNLIRLYSKI